MKQILILLFSILLISCGSRKVTIQENKKDSLSQISSKIGTEEVINLQTKNDIITDEFTITPLDTCKDIIVNGKKYKNVVLRYKKTKDNTIDTKSIKVSKIEEKQQTTKVKENSKVKDIKKTSNPIGLIIIILLIFIFIRFLYPPLKKYFLI